MCARGLVDREDIASAFSAIGFQLLGARTVSFECSCSEDRVLQSIGPIYQREGQALFDPGREDLDVKCEYCKSQYRISREELKQAVGRLH